ncbi:hypothetical protein KXR56_19445 [Bacillus inaquosorum]
MEEGKLVHMTLDGIKKAGSNYGTFPMFHHGGYVMEDATFRFRDYLAQKELLITMEFKISPGDTS